MTITAEELRKLLKYNPETGDMYWSKNGKKAGCVRHDGYVIIGIKYKLYLRHRLAWLYVTGEWPENGIDHKNRIKGDDRFCNLRKADQFQNLANVKLKRKSKSGVQGVEWMPKIKKWRVRVGCRENREHVGVFKDLEEAKVAYDNARRRKYGEFAGSN